MAQDPYFQNHTPWSSYLIEKNIFSKMVILGHCPIGKWPLSFCLCSLEVISESWILVFLLFKLKLVVIIISLASFLDWFRIETVSLTDRLIILKNVCLRMTMLSPWVIWILSFKEYNVLEEIWFRLKSLSDYWWFLSCLIIYCELGYFLNSFTAVLK